MKLQSKTSEATALTDWRSEPTWKDLDEDYTNARADHEIFLSDLDIYRTTLSGGEKIKVRKGKSNLRPLLVRKNNEWKYSQLEEPFLSTQNIVSLQPKGPDDYKTYKQTEMLINHYWAVWVDRIALVGDISRCVTDEGTVIVKNGWRTDKEDYYVTEDKPVYADAEQSLMLLNQAVEGGSMSPEEAQARLETGTPMQIDTEQVKVKKTRLLRNHPTHDVCELDHVVIDPTCKGVLQNAQFIVHEYDIDYSTIIKDKFDPETGVGYYKNIDAIDFNKDWNETDDSRTTYDAARNNPTSFIFADKARKKVRIREYWGKWDIDGTGITKPIVASWVGDTLVRLEKNPFPHQELPFSATTYMPVRGKIHGQPDGALLKENQESIRKMTNAYHDITTTNAIGQKLVMEDTFGGQSEWDAFDKGNDARFRPGVDITRAIHQANVNPVDPAVFNVIDRQNQESESLTGNSLYDKGLGGDSKNSVGSMNKATSSSGRRELSILRRMSSQLFKHMIRQDIANMQVFASPKEVVRLTNETYQTVSIEDIQGQYDVKIDVSTPAKDAETAETLAFVLQTAGEGLPPELKNKVWSDILTLKGRPDLAKDFEMFKPQPSEEELAMQKMQMENAQLENQLLQMKISAMQKDMQDVDSKIQDRTVKAETLYQSEADLNIARAGEHDTKKDYYEELGDRAAQDYLKEESGVNRREKIEDQVFLAESKAEIEALKSYTALQNKTSGEK